MADKNHTEEEIKSRLNLGNTQACYHQFRTLYLFFCNTGRIKQTEKNTSF
jgi:hypothetical protein